MSREFSPPDYFRLASGHHSHNTSGRWKCVVSSFFPSCALILLYIYFNTALQIIFFRQKQPHRDTCAYFYWWPWMQVIEVISSLPPRLTFQLYISFCHISFAFSRISLMNGGILSQPPEHTKLPKGNVVISLYLHVLLVSFSTRNHWFCSIPFLNLH